MYVEKTHQKHLRHRLYRPLSIEHGEVQQVDTTSSALLAELFRSPPTWPSTTPRKDAPDIPFPFFSLPYELRNQIYIHIFPPRGLHYRQPTSKAITWWKCHTRNPRTHLSLSLTSRKIHSEAQEMLFLTYTITLPPNHWLKRNHLDECLPLRQTLHSFPSLQASMVTRVSKEYHDYTPLYLGSAEEQTEIDSLFAIWSHIVCESHIAQEYFPRLRRFEVRWRSFGIIMMERHWWRVADCGVNGGDERGESGRGGGCVDGVTDDGVEMVRRIG